MFCHFPTLLSRWRGSHAQLHELTVSHRTLRIVLRRPGQNGYLLIACICPIMIHALVDWPEADIAIALHGSEGFVPAILISQGAIVPPHLSVQACP
jgi:lambda repressor-like predicted transcriptional regulator